MIPIRVSVHTLSGVLEDMARAIQQGSVIAFPTDTVFGLLADATNAQAVERIFWIKKRDKGKPLPVFVKDIAMAKQLASISKTQERFLKKVWPGKVSVVLQSKHKLPEAVELDGKIALRVPDFNALNRLLEQVDCPLTATSANISGKPSCQSAQEVLEQFQRRRFQPDFLMYGARKLPTSKPSTIVDITGKKHKTLRE